MEAFWRGDYMPHGHCFMWQPGILWTTIISDFLIVLAYFSIPIALVLIVRNRQDIKMRGMFYMFSTFILFCGLTHLISIYNLWHGAYGFHSVVKAMTALVSVATAVFLFKNIKNIINIPSPSQLHQAKSTIELERQLRITAELERKTDAIFRFTTQLLPTGLLVVGEDKKIQLANHTVEDMFGYEEGELLDCDLSVLLSQNDLDHHGAFMDKYFAHPEQGHQMAFGRTVKGCRKSGEEIIVEISLSVHEFEGEKHAFAMVKDAAQAELKKNAQEEADSRLRRAVEATNDGIWEWNVQTEKVWYSPKLMTIIGRPHGEEPTYDAWHSHIHPEDRQHVDDALKEHFETHCKFDVVYRGIGESGDYEWMHTRGNTLFDREGQPVLMSGILTNVEEKIQLQEELKEKSKFLNYVLEKSMTGLYIFDTKLGRNTYINPEYTRITGYALEDLNEEHIFDRLVHPEDRSRMHEHLQKVVALKDNIGMPIEYRYKHKDGHWVWCYSRDFVYSFNQDGVPKEIIGTFIDISELKRREVRIRQLAQDFITTFEQAAVGIAHLSADGHFFKINQKFGEILRYEIDVLKTLSLEDLIHEEDLQLAKRMLARLEEGSCESEAREIRYRRGDASIVWTMLTVSIVRSTLHEPPHFILVLEDISISKTIEFALERSNKSLENFAYAVSHDLQEPVRKVNMFAQLLGRELEGKLDSNDVKYQLERIVDGASRIQAMIKSLLQLARCAGNQVEREEMPVGDIVKTLQDDLAEMLNQAGASIDLKGHIRLFVERESFLMVLRNLVVNSLKYSRQGIPPKIVIQAEEGPNSVLLRVSDNGVGLTESQVELAFEPFKRFSENDVQGTGMGLAICRQIVRAHHGEIWAEYVPEGAMFVIELPRHNAFYVQ